MLIRYNTEPKDERIYIMIQSNQHSMSGKDIVPVEREVYRYLGYARVNPDERVEGLVTECIKELQQVSIPKSAYRIFDMEKTDETLRLGFADVRSKDLAKNLKGCQKIIVFAATIGPRVDRLIQRNSRMNALKGVVMQSVGAMLIESYCDQINNELKYELAREGYILHPRFSPGYGDLSLEHQRDIFKVIDCSRQLGLTLMDSLIMAPSKSVTAIIGMEYRPELAKDMCKAEKVKAENAGNKCDNCININCGFRM